MKKLLKKIVSVFAVAAMAASMPLSVSADELQDNEITDTVSESKYDIAPGLNLTDEDVDSIIDEMSKLAYEAGMSEEEIADISKIWYKKSDNSGISTYANEYTYPAQHYFTLASLEGGQNVPIDLKVVLWYGHTLDDKFLSVSSYKLYDDSINISNNATELSEPKRYIGDYCYHVDLSLNNKKALTSKEGKLVKFNLETGSLTGIAGYQKIIQSSTIKVYEEIGCDDEKLTLVQNRFGGDYDYLYLTNYVINDSVGAMGDIFYDFSGLGKVDSYDLQYLASAITKKVDLNYVQTVAADIDENNVVDVKDYGYLQKYVKNGVDIF